MKKNPSAVEQILARLDRIEQRLANIEARLAAPPLIFPDPGAIGIGVGMTGVVGTAGPIHPALPVLAEPGKTFFVSTAPPPKVEG